MGGWLGGFVLADVRRRAGSLVLLTALVAVTGAFVLAPIAGARRTTSALERLRERSDSADATVQYESADPDVDVARLLADLPGVTAVGETAIALAVPDDGDFDSSDFSYGNLSVVAVDGAYGNELERGQTIAGQAPDPDDPLAVVVSRTLADRLDLTPGDELPVVSLAAAQLDCVFSGCAIERPEGPRLVLHVAAVQQFVSEAFGDGNPQQMLLTPAFAERYLDEVAAFGDIFHVRLADGVDGVDAFRTSVATLAEQRGDIIDQTSVVGALDEAVGIIDASSFAARGLLLVSGLAALALLVAFAQATARHAGQGSTDRQVLRAIGVGRRAAHTGTAGALAVPVLVGSTLAAIAALAVSPLFPLGQARAAEPVPGYRADLVVLGVGALGLASSLLLVVVGVSRREARRADRARRPIARLGATLPPIVSLGLRAGLRPGPAAAPAGQAVAGVAAAVALVCGAAVFVSSLERFVDDPERDGWSFTWEVAQGAELGSEDSLADARAVAARPGVEGVTAVRIADGPELPGVLVQAYGSAPVRGEVGLALVAGRGPVADDEVALGAETARDLDVAIGARLELPDVDGATASFRVVGTARFPLIATDRPDQGAWLTLDGLARIAPETSSFPTLLVDVDPSADPAALADDLAVDHPYIGMVPQSSTDVASLAQVDRLPTAVAGLAGFIGAAALLHALVVGTRARRDELAVLRSIGMRRREVVATVSCHALALVGVGLAVGGPLGLVAGRLTWGALARAVGVAPDPLVPPVVVLVAPVVLVIALVAARAVAGVLVPPGGDQVGPSSSAAARGRIWP